ncbi:Hypothetical protein, putative [Bodo saltans]|uniref:Uncharacterized protein n=1 Tax=Bodo saltans TaxID=75058 RepID=A0A0S4JXL0_BODSA|nr:Hypothetical protein, putative [Bodo saltans]|eukprot:CUG93882.1 Hypothetical protein, putative [Bodo saltans]
MCQPHTLMMTMRNTPTSTNDHEHKCRFFFFFCISSHIKVAGVSRPVLVKVEITEKSQVSCGAFPLRHFVAGNVLFSVPHPFPLRVPHSPPKMGVLENFC